MKQQGKRKGENGDGLDVLILGVGNILLGDEGLGVRTVEEFSRRYAPPDRVEVVDGGTMGMELLPYLAGRSHLFIVDAIKDEARAAGEAVRIELTGSTGRPANRSTPHQVGLSEVLAMAALTDQLPAAIVLFGAKPNALDTGLSLSPAATAGVERLLALLVTELATLGLKPRPR